MYLNTHYLWRHALARLDEHRGKQLLAAAGISVPEGDRAQTAQEARAVAERLGGPSMVKALALVTGRAGRGWVRMAETPEDAERHAAELLAAPEVKAVRVERKLAIAREYFAAVLVDDRAGCPVAVLSSRGGSGIEQIAAEYPADVVRRPVSVREGLLPYMGREMAAQVGITGAAQVEMGTLLARLYDAFRRYDCRSIEVNPLVWTEDGKLVAADCHAAVDDYAVFRHPELGIRIAREIGHDPSARELLAYEVERSDYRGTFFFIELADAVGSGAVPGAGQDGGTAAAATRDAGKTPALPQYVAFHGAGGGGSMMSMDALMKEGFAPANFCDTSGNPPACKVYRAAKILLSQAGIVGYFASGSGVASQEQWQSANGFVKAFRELGLAVPAVIRLGGNLEERAIETLCRFCADVGAPVEAYGKDDSARFCAQRLRALVDSYTPPATPAHPEPISEQELPQDAYRFATLTGSVAIDQRRWTAETAAAVAAVCPTKILKVEEVAGQPQVVLAVTEAEAKKGKCIECLACELKSYELGVKAIRIDLPMPEVADSVGAASRRPQDGGETPPLPMKGGAR